MSLLGDTPLEQSIECHVVCGSQCDGLRSVIPRNEKELFWRTFLNSCQQVGIRAELQYGGCLFVTRELGVNHLVVVLAEATLPRLLHEEIGTT